MEWETIIGLEIHCQLASKSKLFSHAPTNYGAPANTQACAVDLGIPGTLPVINKQAIEMAIRFGLAIDAEIAGYSVFARKHYFYPDLPKGYQISQYELPIVRGGRVTIEPEHGTTRTITVNRAHLEEDAGKSIHEGFGKATGIDLNRAGIPLLEIVSEPEIHSASEAVAYMKAIHSLVRYLNISDGNMQEGSFRCDVNLSLRPQGQTQLGPRVELKNINSFRFVEQAIQYEIERQRAILVQHGTILQETRLYDPGNNETRAMRSKEEANDYRYFPDPDLLPIKIEKQEIARIGKQLPELPDVRKKRFVQEYGLSVYDSTLLTTQKEVADYFEACVGASGGEVRLSANWINGDLTACLHRDNRPITDNPVKPAMLGKMIKRIKDNTISNAMAKQVFEAMWQGEGDPDQIIQRRGLRQVSDMDRLGKTIEDILSSHPQQVKLYQNAPPEKQKKLIGFFVGQAMKSTQGKANPKQLNHLLVERLGKLS